jgi:putative transporter with 12 TMs
VTAPPARKLYRSGWKELVFQATYAVRSGNPPPDGDPKQFSRKARQRVILSQGAASGFLALVILGGVSLLSDSLETLVAGPALPRVLYIACVLGGLFIVQLGLLWWLGLQFLPTFLSSSIVPVLRTLPVPGPTVDRVALLLLARLFDAPALTCLVVTPLAVGLSLGSLSAALAVVPAEVTVVVLAMAFAVATGRFFVRNVQGSPGGHRATALRWAYLVLWGTPAFALFGFVALAPRFLNFVGNLSFYGPAGELGSLLSVYPFAFALLPALATSPSSVDVVPIPGGLLGVLALLLVYTLPVALAGRWLLTAPGKLAALTTPGRVRRGAHESVRVRPAPLAILVKDLRLASRTPAFAFLILIPLGDAMLLGLWTAFSPLGTADPAQLAEAAVASAALLATFFGPAFFAIEVMSYSYSRSLPLTGRNLLIGKTTLILFLYSIAASVVLLLTLVRYFHPLEFGAFLLAEVPAVAAAALFQLGILLAVARRRGLPLVNLYTGAFWLAAVSVPGLIVAGTPLALYAILAPAGLGTALLVMAAFATAEFTLVASVTLTRFGGSAS